MKGKEIYKLIGNFSKSNNKFLDFANTVAALSVIIGTLALLLSLSILNGFSYKLQDIATQFTSDICVQTINGSPINETATVTKKLEKLQGIKSAIPVLQTEGIITINSNNSKEKSNESFVEGTVFQSINPENDVKNFAKNVVAGEFSFSNDTAAEVIISSSLSSKLGIGLGEELMLYALTADKQISFSTVAYSKFKVKCIYKTGTERYDNSVIFLSHAKLANFLERSQNSATYFEVFVNDENKELATVTEISAQIEDSLGYPFFPLTFYELNSSLFSWIDFQKKPIPLVLAIISLVASFNIVTMLIITVVEKSHTIGILRALGMQRNDILRIFIFLSVRLSVISSFIGIFLSLIFIVLQDKFSLISLDSKIYFIDSLPVHLEFSYIFGVFGLTVLFSFLASLLPALIAIKISPVKAIRFK
jgi:lipoprotein-releasing system permease protein